ncbi:MAG: hypothetical protein AAF721_38990 [Myxococcota bacterium]
MGLFDRKRTAEPEPEPEPAPAPAPAAQAAPAKPAAAPKKAEPARAAKPEPAKPTYGIQNAIELMRQLPKDNVPLVVEVVKKTLESLHVDIASIIGDAERKHARIDERVANLQVEIRDFEDEIAARKQEIEALTADRDETKTVKERLELAQSAAAGARAKPRPATVPKPGESSTQGAAASQSSTAGKPEPSASQSSSWGSQRASGTVAQSKPS